MASPDPADVLVARSSDRIAVIAMRKDQAAALELVLDLHEHRADVVISLRHDTAPTPTVRRTMPAKFAGACAKCSGAIRVGEGIFYDYEAKKAVHAGCA